MRLLGASQPFDGGDVLVGNRPRRRVARGHYAIADNDVAGAAFVGAATQMRTGHAELPAQDIEQRSVGVAVDISLDAIEAESDTRHRKWDLGFDWTLTYGLSPNFLTTSAHFTISLRRYLSNSSAALELGNPPCSGPPCPISPR